MAISSQINQNNSSLYPNRFTLRIISGNARGRKLFPPRNNSIRPTSDRAREALFSILGERVEGSCILDCYAGTGALGIEALSRGAKSAVFIDNSKDSLENTAKNIQLVYPYLDSPMIKVIQHNLAQSLPLRKLESINFGKADIIFADPPYSKGLGQLFLDQLGETKLLQSTGIVVIEERVSEILPEKTTNFLLQERRTYGEASFWFYTPLQ
ncbi:hypothetical protein DP2773 [Desulfotalea psychrophila LSv54]|uniref:16S rRNA (Guanine(966)-N(2))-methyltransferase RsmD n=1 Tax=Desulfotalea psychrophila (strain LSv54 / DSM 12343) TaxID=177439 RepID=Q6AJH8_DESPS|nr:hypothetical protein DP2773 [Desulfotalea psychrophila LSv54]